MKNRQPARDIIHGYQTSGVAWTAVESQTLRRMIEDRIAAGQEVTTAMATADLLYWIWAGDVKPHRYYAERWGWDRNRAYDLFLSLGIYGKSSEKQNGSRTEAERKQNGAIPDEKEGIEKQKRSKSEAEEKQYSISVSESVSEPPNPQGGKRKDRHKYDEQAEEIYAAYPFHVGKPKAIAAIVKALTKIAPAALLERTQAYAAVRGGNIDAKPHVPYPATWYNGERYNDDPATWAAWTDGSANGNGQAAKPDLSLRRAAK